MRSSVSYLDAAAAVLRSHGKPMHYESIANLAAKLGLLHGEASHYQTAMSSALSRDIRENRGSLFVREGRGLYRLRGSSFLELTGDDGQRIDRFEARLGVGSRLVVLRKALFLLQQASERVGAGSACALRCCGGCVEVDFRAIVRRASGLGGHGRWSTVQERVDREILAGVESHRRRLRVPANACVVYAGLELLEHAIALGISVNDTCSVESVDARL